MSQLRLNLVVLRVADIERSVEFYRRVGLAFTPHAHGTGPQHYACETDGCVFELYAATPEQPAIPAAPTQPEIVEVEPIEEEPETITVLGQQVAPVAGAAEADLPFTGARTFGLTLLGLAAFLAGAALVRRRPRRMS